MSLSSTALEQREKEAQALRFFLIYSLIGSIVLHIGVLALGWSHFWMRLSQVKDKPIEVAIIAAPTSEVAKPPENRRSQTTGNGGGGNLAQKQTATGAITSILGRKHSTAQTSQQLQPKSIQPPASPRKKLAQTFKTSPQQPTALKTAIANETAVVPNPSSQKLVERLKTAPQTPTALSTPVAQGLSTSPTSTAAQSAGERSLTSSQPTGNSTANGSGTGIGNGTGNVISNGSGIGNGTGNVIGNGSGTGIGNGTGNGVGNGAADGVNNQPKKQETTVATAPKPPIDNSSRLDRADCLKCDIKYPDRARRRGVEGSPEVAVDTDEHGNVTRVRLIRSSGERELDEAAQRAAQEWKLKPTSTARQGVRASVNFAMQGSRRHRELQEQQRQRERQAAQKKPETTAAIPTPTDTPQARQHSTTGVVKDIPLENSTRRSRDSAPSPQATPRKRVESDTTNPPQETTPRRLRRIESNTPSQSQESRSEGVQTRRRQLEDILRRPKTSDFQEGNAERLQRRRKRLEEILRRRPQPAASPTTDAPAPSSKPPTDSNVNSTNNN